MDAYGSPAPLLPPRAAASPRRNPLAPDRSEQIGYAAARTEALTLLIARHRGEYDLLLAEAKKARGLPW